MAYAIQYDFFEANDEDSLNRRELALVRKELTNVRKGVFARHGEMMKLLMKQQEEIDQLKNKMKKSLVA